MCKNCLDLRQKNWAGGIARRTQLKYTHFKTKDTVTCERIRERIQRRQKIFWCGYSYNKRV